METEEMLKKRLRELAQKCYQSSQYTFTDFLGLGEASCFYEIEKELSYVPCTIWGGACDTERVMIRFGGAEQLGYEEDFPIVCLKIIPLSEKFADALTHRDYLGALMNLGIERDTLGDIVRDGNAAWLFCMDKIADYIKANLTRVKHTAVMCTDADDPPASAQRERQEMKIQVTSERIDCVAAKLCRLSRSEASELFRQKRIFVDGRLCENNSRELKPGEKVSIRGYGRFEFAQETGISKKGKMNILVYRYGN